MKSELFILMIIAAMVSGCAGKAEPVKSAPATPAAQPQKAPAPAVSAPPAVAVPQPPADYLGTGVKIAAIQIASWEDTAFMAKAYPVKIAKEASVQSENKFFVEPVVPVEGSGNYGSDLWKWTPFVFNSRPAKKEELAAGMLVLCVDLDRPLSTAELQKAVWRLRKVSDTAKLFQDIVEVSFYDTYYHTEKKLNVNLANVRIVEDKLEEKDLTFKK